MPRLLDSFPALYEPLLPDFFQREIPAETKATCDSCAMCPSAGRSGSGPLGTGPAFRHDLKCCTFHPPLPNYLVGALLSDDDPALSEGQRRVEQKIASRVGINPQWVKSSERYDLLFKSSRHGFGQAEALRCPYFDLGAENCTIWRYRDAVCSTYFCKYVAGADGMSLWVSLKKYLSLVQHQLSRYAVFRLSPDYLFLTRERNDQDSGPLTPNQLDERAPSEPDYQAMWRTWERREAEFYRACFEEVRKLSAADLEALLGFGGTLELSHLERLFGTAVSPELPQTLHFNWATRVQWLPDGNAAFTAYSEYEAIVLPGKVYGLLLEFNGRRTVEEARQRLREHRQTDLSEELLLALHQHRILLSS